VRKVGRKNDNFGIFPAKKDISRKVGKISDKMLFKNPIRIILCQELTYLYKKLCKTARKINLEKVCTLYGLWF